MQEGDVDIFSLLFVFQVQVDGYNHKQQSLLNRIMEKMTAFQIDEKRFEVIKETVSHIGKTSFFNFILTKGQRRK